MTADTLLAQLAALDVTLWVEGARLLFDAPPGVLTPERRAVLSGHKAELVRLLGPPTVPEVDSDEQLPAATAASHDPATANVASTVQSASDKTGTKPHALARDKNGPIGRAADGGTVPRCRTHVDAADWLDHAPVDGRIRTTCRRCGAFIGYRPAGAGYNL